MQSSFSSPIGGDPLQAEGVRLTCILELAVGAGALRLTSTDPTVQPHLDYRYLEDPWDRQRLREAVRLCARLLEHDTYAEIVQARLAPTDQELASDDALDAWLRHNVTTSQHISGLPNRDLTHSKKDSSSSGAASSNPPDAIRRRANRAGKMTSSPHRKLIRDRP